ncbi:hypothetical protein TNCV_1819761 [Trichonephila clavipes]|nr:hypothetical protein TNCV_1819761 [Trichonephila clavipes]
MDDNMDQIGNVVQSHHDLSIRAIAETVVFDKTPHPSSIVVSDADCYIVRIPEEAGVFEMYSALAACWYSKLPSNRKSSRDVGSKALSFPREIDLPQNCGGIVPNCTVTCMVLKATVDNRRTSGRLPR